MQKIILYPLTIMSTIISLLLCFQSSAIETKAKQAILIDAATQTVLFEKNAYKRTAPSSMSKMMTAYIAFDFVKRGIISIDDTFITSAKAWRKGGSRMFLPVNKPARFEDLLKGLIIQSGNDAAIAITEAISGSEEVFTEVMNRTAIKIGLKNSHFANSTGWPAPDHYMSTHDIAMLALRTIEDFPEYYHYYSEKEFAYNNIKQPNRNGLLYRNIGADGLKTGHADAAGYGLAASATKNGRRLIAVVNGLSSDAERSREAEKLLKYGFTSFSNIVIAKKGETIEKVQTWYGNQEETELVSNQDIVLTLPTALTNSVKVRLSYNLPIIAPITAGQSLASLNIEVEGQESSKSFELTAKDRNERASFFGKLFYNIRLMLS
jgi:serine-type D-Ala-D-Ala carboxypeptidase (penicillin-binding protein 5/6)